MKDAIAFSPTGAPPSVDTSKTHYQSRHAVSATTTPGLAFPNSAEGGLMPQQRSEEVMPLTPINGHSPTADERGTPSAQNSKGA